MSNDTNKMYLLPPNLFENLIKTSNEHDNCIQSKNIMSKLTHKSNQLSTSNFDHNNDIIAKNDSNSINVSTQTSKDNITSDNIQETVTDFSKKTEENDKVEQEKPESLITDDDSDSILTDDDDIDNNQPQLRNKKDTSLITLRKSASHTTPLNKKRQITSHSRFHPSPVNKRQSTANDLRSPLLSTHRLTPRRATLRPRKAPLSWDIVKHKK